MYVPKVVFGVKLPEGSVSTESKCLLTLLSVLYEDFSLGMLDWWFAGVCTNFVDAGNVANHTEGVGKGLLHADDVMGCCCGWCVRDF